MTTPDSRSQALLLPQSSCFLILWIPESANLAQPPGFSPSAQLLPGLGNVLSIQPSPSSLQQSWIILCANGCVIIFQPVVSLEKTRLLRKIQDWQWRTQPSSIRGDWGQGGQCMGKPRKWFQASVSGTEGTCQRSPFGGCSSLSFSSPFSYASFILIPNSENTQTPRIYQRALDFCEWVWQLQQYIWKLKILVLEGLCYHAEDSAILAWSWLCQLASFKFPIFIGREMGWGVYL